MKKLIIFLVMCASAGIVFAQQISPSAYTSGGGSYGTTYNLSISIGQSFGNNISGIGAGMTQGVLQPKTSQTVTFNALPNKMYGDAPFALTATASSGLAISYISSNESVATVTGNIVTIVGAGSTDITASQTGNANFNAAFDIPQTLVVAGVGTTKVRTSDCGSTVTTFAKYIYCDVISGATNYEWEFTATDFSFTKIKGNSSAAFYLAWVTGIECSKTYDIRVRVFKNGVWGNFSTTCQITTPPMPTTKVRTDFCGITANTITQYVYCDAVPGAADYEWEFVNTASSFSFTKTRDMISTSMSLSLITGLEYGKTYDVRVRAKVGTQWGAFGTVCTITTPAFPTTKVRTEYCGITATSLSQYVYCDAISGAADFEWEFVNAASGFSFTRVTNTASTALSLSTITGIKFGTVYDVRVRAKKGTQWGSFATTCQITTPAFPTTKVRVADCGITTTSLRQYIYCDAVKGAQDYEWKFENAASSYSFSKIRGTSSSSMNLSWITGLANNKTYDVSVKVKVGGEWSNFGTVCQITTPSGAKLQGNDANEESSFNIQHSTFSISLFPNPIRKGEAFNVTLQSDASINGTTINVYNIIGQIVYTQKINIDANNYSLNIDQMGKFTSGLFIIQAEKNGEVKRLKLIIE